MPLYEYLCDACGKRFEVIQKFSDAAPAACRHCGQGPVQRLASSPAIQFKGSGFYITDYAQKGRSEDTSESKGSETKASESKGSEGKGSEGKSSEGKGGSGTPAASETKSTESASASTSSTTPAASTAPASPSASKT
jgi:putative FmdB family regulatory protein